MRSRALVTIAALASSVAMLARGSDSTSSQQVLTTVDIQPRDAQIFDGAVWPYTRARALYRRFNEISVAGVWSSGNDTIRVGQQARRA